MSADDLAKSFEALMPNLETRLIGSEGAPGSPWYRVKLDGRDAQVGLKNDTWVVSICLGSLNTDPSVLPRVIAAIEKANGKLPKGAQPAKLVERDCVLYAEAVAAAPWVAGTAGPPSDDSPAALRALRVAALVSAARELAKLDAGARILGSFGR